MDTICAVHQYLQSMQKDKQLLSTCYHSRQRGYHVQLPGALEQQLAKCKPQSRLSDPLKNGRIETAECSNMQQGIELHLALHDSQ